MSEGAARLAGGMRLQALGCRALGSPFYAGLLDLMATDTEAGGPASRLLASYADRPFEDAVAVRLLGGLHRLVLAGELPPLAARYPSTGGDGDAAGAWPVVRAALVERAADLAPFLTRPPQTNEVGRAAALGAGLAVVAAETGRPLRLLEIGASAGLNLLVDRYWFECRGQSWGEVSSPVRFVDAWEGGCPPFAAAATIVERAGCDRHPIDPRSEDGRLTLLAYVWPDQHERLALLRAALDVAARVAVPVTRADADVWLAERLGEMRVGIATVVQHSVVWQYLSESARSAITGALDAAAMQATEETPLAWLRFEPPPDLSYPELRLTRWPGGEERWLATSSYHVGPVRWMG